MDKYILYMLFITVMTKLCCPTLPYFHLHIPLNPIW